MRRKPEILPEIKGEDHEYPVADEIADLLNPVELQLYKLCKPEPDKFQVEGGLSAFSEIYAH